ncbi:MAG: hypothetical protein M1820_001351 [Bogoriella megaspora]|nr:MAG: hypothetical protein M1820_001351 [Bogoriella megaspora]
MTRLKVLISGGGVAGTALAFWLSKVGHDVTVVEWFPNLRTTGLQIDLRGPGIEVLRRMGLEQAFRDKAAPEEGLQFVDSSGRKRAYFPANKSGKGAQSFTSEFEIMRGDLCRLIHDATENRAKYIFGTSVASFEEKQTNVEVHFKDGKTDFFDLLVGADGVFSATRKMILGSDAADVFHPIGETNAYMTFQRPIQEGERYVGSMYLATKRRSMLVRRHNPKEMQLYLLLNYEDERLKRIHRGDVKEEKAAFTEIFQDAGGRTPELLEALQDADDFYCERLGVVKMDTWVQGRVALIGDAAYSPGGSGMGTSCALIGAYVLAGEISKHCGGPNAKDDTAVRVKGEDDLAAALKAYDQTFRPYMNHVQAGLGKSPSWLMPSNAFGIAVLHWILEAIAFLWVDPIVNWFMKGSEEKWKLPEYEKMIQAGGKNAAQA